MGRAPVEAALHRELPTDYKALVNAYGSGSFCDYISLMVPADVQKAYDIVKYNALASRHAPCRVTAADRYATARTRAVTVLSSTPYMTRSSAGATRMRFAYDPSRTCA